jgi:hypothetical protein
MGGGGSKVPPTALVWCVEWWLGSSRLPHMTDAATRLKADYYRAKAAGMCVRRGCKAASRPGRIYCAEHMAALAERRDRNFRKNIEAGRCKCGRPRDGGRRKCERCRKLAKRATTGLLGSARRRRASERERSRVFSAYGARCVCCGETERAFLQVDHVRNNGAQERRANPNTTNARLAIRSGFSSDYQVLCANCNWAKSVLGKCPHQQSPPSALHP